MEHEVIADRVLVVPGYTDAEIKKINDKKGEVKTPKAFYFEVLSVEYQPRIKQFEEFESAQGLIPIEKACDKYAELELEVLVHQSMNSNIGNMELDKQERDVQVLISEYDPKYDNRFLDPYEITESYIKIRSGFFDYLIGRPLTMVSALFPTIGVCYIKEISYQIGEGEEHSVWKVAFQEYINSSF